MKFNDTAPVLAPADGPPRWLARLAGVTNVDEETLVVAEASM